MIKVIALHIIIGDTETVSPYTRLKHEFCRGCRSALRSALCASISPKADLIYKPCERKLVEQDEIGIPWGEANKGGCRGWRRRWKVVLCRAMTVGFESDYLSHGESWSSFVQLRIITRGR